MTLSQICFLLAIVNLQYLTILIKSELQDVNLQFQYRSLISEIKNIWFLLCILSWKQACIENKGHVICVDHGYELYDPPSFQGF